MFSDSLTDNLHHLAPLVNPEKVFVAGASGFQDAVPKAALPGVVLSYSKAVDDVFHLTVGAAAAAFVRCWGMGWKSAEKAKAGAPEV